MKRKIKLIALSIILVLLIVCMIVALKGCDKKVETRYFATDIEAYTEVAQYFKAHYVEIARHNLPEGASIYNIDYLKLDFNDFRHVDAALEDSVYDTMAEFAFAWLRDEFVVFWKDSTMNLGIMYSQNPERALEKLEELMKRTGYKDLKYEELNQNWFTIGRW